MRRTAATLLITLTLLGATKVNANLVPVADANGPYEIFAGNSLTLDASGSFDPDGDPLAFTWDINNDGVFGDAAGAMPTLSWSELLALGLAANWFNSLTVRVDDGQLSDVSSTSLRIKATVPVPATLGLFGLGLAGLGLSRRNTA